MKRIPEALVKKYIALDSKIEKLKEEKSEIKKKLLLYYDKGWESHLLRFRESSIFRPNWKILVRELTKKYMSPGQCRVYFSKLKNRFPRKVVKTSIIILSKDRRRKGDYFNAA